MTVNQEIQAPYVEVKIWWGGSNFEYLGKMPLEQALIKARSLGLDLVQQSKKPVPLCYITDEGQSLYIELRNEQLKRLSEQRLGSNKERQWRAPEPNHQALSGLDLKVSYQAMIKAWVKSADIGCLLF